MSGFSDQLSQAASRNHELLSTLHQTDYAPPACEQNNAYISELQQQISETELDLYDYHVRTEHEREDHLKYKDSVMKRYAYKLGGSHGKEKFAARSEKEEREYLEAWQRERESQDALDNLQSALSNAEGQKGQLEKDKATSTPQVPGEDQVEQEVEQARGWFDQYQMQSDGDQRALKPLQLAAKPMKLAFNNMNCARDASRLDMLGGGALVDIMERDELSSGQMQLTKALRCYDEATQAQPAIGVLNDVHIDNGHLMSDVLFDNIFTNTAQHGRIMDAQAQMQSAASQLKDETAKQGEKAKASQGQLQQAQAQLGGARKRLQDIRSQAFEQYSQGAPPTYGAW